jgi:hypothetical protein
VAFFICGERVPVRGLLAVGLLAWLPVAALGFFTVTAGVRIVGRGVGFVTVLGLDGTVARAPRPWVEVIGRFAVALEPPAAGRRFGVVRAEFDGVRL